MNLFRDIQSSRWLYAKGLLLAALALISGGLLILTVPRVDVLALLLICIWASCRAYYFAFYVVEHYADPGYRFSGLIDFARYVATGRHQSAPTEQGGKSSVHD